MKKNAQVILDLIHSSKEHLTAEQIYNQLCESGTKLALATVYNNLSWLYEEGHIRKVCVDGYPDRYDKIKPHDHLVCQSCGKLTDINFPDLTQLLQSQTSETLLSYDLQAIHICPQCQGKKVQKGQPFSS